VAEERSVPPLWSTVQGLDPVVLLPGADVKGLAAATFVVHKASTTVVHRSQIVAPSAGRILTLLAMTSTRPVRPVTTGPAVQPDRPAQPLVITTDDALLDPVLAVCASADVQPTVEGDPAAVRAGWSAASAVIIGVDQAEDLCRIVLPRRDHVYLVGDQPRLAELCRWSVQLHAAVITVPEGAAALSSALATVRSGAGRGVVVTLVGGSGGVGTSTLAAGLAWSAARRGLATLLVDLDPLGGGLDLLVGVEQLDGWRWPRLRSASGHLGDLRGQLPHLEGMDVLAIGRDDESEAGVTAVAAVLSSAGGTHPLVVVDLGRELGVGAREAIRLSDVTLLVTGTDVRSVAAARSTAGLVRPLARDLRLVVRTGAGGAGVSPTVAGEAVEAPVLGVVPQDPRLRLAAEHGDPPGRASRPRWNRSVRELVDRLVQVAG